MDLIDHIMGICMAIVMITMTALLLVSVTMIGILAITAAVHLLSP